MRKLTLTRTFPVDFNTDALKDFDDVDFGVLLKELPVHDPCALWNIAWADNHGEAEQLVDTNESNGRQVLENAQYVN